MKLLMFPSLRVGSVTEGDDSLLAFVRFFMPRLSLSMYLVLRLSLAVKGLSCDWLAVIVLGELSLPVSSPRTLRARHRRVVAERSTNAAAEADELAPGRISGPRFARADLDRLKPGTPPHE